MTNLKHSKGEWLRDGKTVYSLHQRGWSNGKPLMVNRFYLSVYPDISVENAEEEAEANAKLIAAAPDLLEAIQSALSISDLWTYFGAVLEEHKDEAAVLDDMKKKFEKAIEKATK